MCNQRETIAVLRRRWVARAACFFSVAWVWVGMLKMQVLRLRAARFAQDDTVVISAFSLVVFAVVEGGVGDFLSAGEGELRWGFAVEVDLLLQEAVGSVFAGSLDEDGVLAGFDGLACVVLAVPAEGVLAGGAGGGGDGGGEVAALGEIADLVGAV